MRKTWKIKVSPWRYDTLLFHKGILLLKKKIIRHVWFFLIHWNIFFLLDTFGEFICKHFSVTNVFLKEHAHRKIVYSILKCFSFKILKDDFMIAARRIWIPAVLCWRHKQFCGSYFSNIKLFLYFMHDHLQRRLYNVYLSLVTHQIYLTKNVFPFSLNISC